jgi:hypothetical protein
MTVRSSLLVLLAASSLPAFAGAPGGAPKMDPQEIQALRTYCKADIERLCAGVQPGGGRIKECLMANKEQMSVGCAQALQKLKQSRQQ